MKTEFEVGKTYKTRGGKSARILHIRDDGPYPVKALVEGAHIANVYTHAGEFARGQTWEVDLLPAIDSAPERAPFLDPARESLEAVKDAWEDFCYVVSSEKVDPTRGGVCICGKMGLSIQCSYPDRHVAAIDAAKVIAGLDALLEGRQP